MSGKKITQKNIDIYLKKNNSNKDNINLITQYFQSDNKKRFKENLYCLYKNINNPYINTIYLLNEKIYTPEELKLDKIPEKVIQINIGKRLMFKDIFEFINKNNIKGYLIISNLDIFFNSTLKNIFKTSLMVKKSVYCQLRYEFFKKNHKKMNMKRSCSQDTWIYHSNNKINNIKNFDYYFGQFGCDVRTNFLFAKQGFTCYNYPSLINCIHVHESMKRNYKLKPIKKYRLLLTPIY